MAVFHSFWLFIHSNLDENNLPICIIYILHASHQGEKVSPSLPKERLLVMVVAAQQRITVNMRLHDDQWQAHLVHASNECSDADDGSHPTHSPTTLCRREDRAAQARRYRLPCEGCRHPSPEDFWRTKTWYAVRLGLHAPRRPSGLGAKARLEADAGTEASVSCINAPRISPTRNQARLF